MATTNNAPPARPDEAGVTDVGVGVAAPIPDAGYEPESGGPSWSTRILDKCGGAVDVIVPALAVVCIVGPLVTGIVLLSENAGDDGSEGEFIAGVVLTSVFGLCCLCVCAGVSKAFIEVGALGGH